MLAIFADAAYYFRISQPGATSSTSRRSSAAATPSPQPIVTTYWVVQELADGLSSPAWRSSFLRIFATIESDGQTTLIPFDQGLWRRGLDLYSRRPDKAWSLTDCISFVVMTDRGLTDALTGDHHFEQAGFRALLRQG